MKSDEFYIKRCIELASKASGQVSPNPLVGCVIVRNGEIISEDYHRKFGDWHAERNAINKISDQDLSDCEIFINLEPCTHFGKTPPCTNLIIEKKFKRVIFGTFDPNPIVAGKSLEKLRHAKITTAFKILEKECRNLNRFFFKHIRTNLPWSIAKFARTKDGFISSGIGVREQITGKEARKDAHKWRSIIDAILIGKNTALVDNPMLTVRSVEGRNPHRFVLDSKLDLPLELSLFKNNDDKKTHIICSQNADQVRKNLFKDIGINLIELPEQNGINLRDIISKIGKMGLNSLLIEGGAKLLNQFFEQDLIDEIQEYISKKEFSAGLSVNFKSDDFIKISSKNLGNDIFNNYYRKDNISIQ